MIEEVKLVIGMAVLQYGNLRIDPNQRRVYVNEQVVELTTMEFNILYYLALHPGWTFTREQLYQYAMPNDFAFVDQWRLLPFAVLKIGIKMEKVKTQSEFGQIYRIQWR